MANKPISDTIPQAADGSGLYRRKLVAGMAVILADAACTTQASAGTFNFARADYVPPPANPATPTPVAAPATVPARPADHTPELLLVGPGKPYPLLADAGERLVQKWQKAPDPARLIVSPGPPGYYVNDGDTYSRRFDSAKRPAWPPYHGILQADVVIEGEPGKPRPDLVSDGYGDGVLYYQKGIFVVAAGVNATFRHLRMGGWRRQDGNGNYASVRLEPSAVRNLVLFEDCYIDRCDNGIMGGEGPTEVTVRDTEFWRNGSGTGLTHNFYFGQVALLQLERVLSHGAVVGHEGKSRARRTRVLDCRMLNGASGTASYTLDVPDGGILEVNGLVTHKGPHASNAASINFGTEHPERQDKHAITIRGWTMLGEPPAGEAPWGGPSGLVNGTAAVPDIKGTQVFGVSSRRLYLKGDWAPFPDAGVTMLRGMPALPELAG